MSDAPTKYYFRQRQRNRLYDAVIKAIEEAAARDHVRRKDIAEKLEIPPSLVTRLLSGPANWTSDTMSDLLFSIGAELEFRVVRLDNRAGGDQQAPKAIEVRRDLPASTDEDPVHSTHIVPRQPAEQSASGTLVANPRTPHRRPAIRRSG
jgi:plasmid maintenance system antidote protein VapI